jgi:hypothetical protein
LSALDPHLLETLLNMSESSVLDFKRAQYPFANADDNAKAEIVKDVLAFANAWKTADAHIVIGAEDGRGSRATVVGVTEHIDDASLQQLVNSKTNVPVEFSYLAATVDAKPIAIIRIASAQQRPVFLRRSFGRLAADTVYMRQGSSTAVAKPDEIARMGAANVATPPEPDLSLALGDPVAHSLHPDPITITPRILVARPVPEFIARMQAEDGARSLRATMRQMRGEPSSEQLAECRRNAALFTQLAFVLKNTGAVLLRDVRVEVAFPKRGGLTLRTEEPPPKPSLYGVSVLERISFAKSDMMVAERDDHVELTARLGKVQTGATVWSDSFWIGGSEALAFDSTARVFSDDLSAPALIGFRFEVAPQRFFHDGSEVTNDDDCEPT